MAIVVEEVVEKAVVIVVEDFETVVDISRDFDDETAADFELESRVAVDTAFEVPQLVVEV